jgi:predicted DNA binding CopG/RHH family protein
MSALPNNLPHPDGLTDAEYDELQAIAAHHDAKARKDATLNMRISSATLDRIKQAAEAQGFPKYQQWVGMVIDQALTQG